MRIAQAAQCGILVVSRGSKVAVPIGGPDTTALVSMLYTPSVTVTAKRSIPRGAGPARFSPMMLY
jgi:hypothetical protein